MFPFTISIKSKIMIALLIIALAVFAYIVYVLLKPEKF
ncbi:potassium-transporting ATPase subunit F [Flavobacterium microcysteis]|nr:potassium-transporting ATPase subunit F [Flavobacterium microcysteis]